MAVTADTSAAVAGRTVDGLPLADTVYGGVTNSYITRGNPFAAAGLFYVHYAHRQVCDRNQASPRAA
jgi:hypothetical protein